MWSYHQQEQTDNYAEKDIIEKLQCIAKKAHLRAQRCKKYTHCSTEMWKRWSEMVRWVSLQQVSEVDAWPLEGGGLVALLCCRSVMLCCLHRESSHSTSVQSYLILWWSISILTGMVSFWMTPPPSTGQGRRAEWMVRWIWQWWNCSYLNPGEHLQEMLEWSCRQKSKSPSLKHQLRESFGGMVWIPPVKF